MFTGSKSILYVHYGMGNYRYRQTLSFYFYACCARGHGEIYYIYYISNYRGIELLKKNVTVETTQNICYHIVIIVKWIIRLHSNTTFNCDFGNEIDAVQYSFEDLN